MRKGIAIFLMLCANIVLLAHAVVPHHHHDNVACFIMTEENGHEQCCDHDSAKHQQKHDADSNNDCCVLNDIQAIIPDNYKQESQVFDFSCKGKNTNHYVLIIISPEIDSMQLSGWPVIRQKPYLVSCHPVFESHSLGFRGPPSC